MAGREDGKEGGGGCCRGRRKRRGGGQRAGDLACSVGRDPFPAPTPFDPQHRPCLARARAHHAGDALVAVAAVHQQQRHQEAELGDGKVGAHGGLCMATHDTRGHAGGTQRGPVSTMTRTTGGQAASAKAVRSGIPKGT